jgi:hypothetical protein
MDVLYKLEKATVADVLDGLPDRRNYSTVRAQLRVLEDIDARWPGDKVD